jgi:hypothetical protein
MLLQHDCGDTSFFANQARQQVFSADMVMTHPARLVNRQFEDMLAI